MESSAGIQASISGRYASALFALARESRSIEAVEASLGRVRAALDTSVDFARLTASPVVSRQLAGRAVAAAADVIDVDPLTRNFLGVLAANRRLREIRAVVRSFTALAARHRGETSAEVTSAHPLTDDQVDALKGQLRARIGSDVHLDLAVDPDLLGGLVVRIGSQRIDSSIRTRLNSLAHAMKG